MPSLSASSFDLYLRTCSADAEQSDGPEKSRSLDPPRSDAPVRDARGAAAHPAQNFSLREKERPASEPLLMRVVSVEVANGSFRTKTDTRDDPDRDIRNGAYCGDPELKPSSSNLVF